MKMSLKNAIWVITFIPLIIYAVLYGYFDETIPYRWNYYGEVMSYMTKTIAVFVIPLTPIFLSLVFYYVHAITGKRKLFGLNYNLFWLFTAITLAFITMFPLYLIAFDGGNTYNVLAFSLLIAAALIMIAGFIFPTFKFEGKYGFITPWTKASENVFYQTQQVASATFIVGSLFLAALTLFMEGHTTMAVAAYILVCLIMMLIPLWYSKNTYENED